MGGSNHKKAFLVAVSCAALGFGCSAGSDDTQQSQASVAAPATSVAFRLYTLEGEDPGPQDTCGPATFTSLTLKETPTGVEGVFNEGTPLASGESGAKEGSTADAASPGIEWPWPCKAVFVVKDYFEYRLARQAGPCGATVYVSTRSTPDGSRIKITDLRKSTRSKRPTTEPPPSSLGMNS
jgi:hypothetical protein